MQGPSSHPHTLNITQFTLKKKISNIPYANEPSDTDLGSDI